MADYDYDVLVIGGGPGGLTTALYLARFRRNVLVVDDSNSRAVKIPRSHNMPGYPDGVPGAELVAAIRTQAQHYGVAFHAGRVQSIRRQDGFFHSSLIDGETMRSRKIVLATGASDIEPEMPYFMEAVRCGALRYCPVCDGYEVIGQTVGVITDNEKGIKEALYLRNFTDKLMLFQVRAEDFDDREKRQLEEANITCIEHPVTSIRLWNGAVTVRHGEQESRCDSLYSALGLYIHNELVPEAERDHDGYLRTNVHQETNVDGIYAVGDVAQGLNQISVAMGDGAKAAAAIHLALGRAW